MRSWIRRLRKDERSWIRRLRKDERGTLNVANLLMLGIGIIFIAVGFIIYPVVLDGVASVLHGGGTGISSSYTGLSSVLGVAPMIVLIAFIAAGVLTGFFGIKNIAKG